MASLFGLFELLCSSFVCTLSRWTGVAANRRRQSMIDNHLHGAIEGNSRNAGGLVDPSVRVQELPFFFPQLLHLRRQIPIGIRDCPRLLGRLHFRDMMCSFEPCQEPENYQERPRDNARQNSARDPHSVDVGFKRLVAE
jgi:hypothetical protein